MSNRYRDSMDRLHFTQEQKQEMVDRLMEAGPVSSVRPLLRFRRFAAVGGPDGEVWMTIGLYFKDMAAGGSQKR